MTLRAVLAATAALLLAGPPETHADVVPDGPEFRVNTYTPLPQRRPAVAAEAGGSFVVVWQSGGYYSGQDGSRTGVFGQRFDGAGAPSGPEFQVNTYTTGPQSDPSVAVDGAGRFTVAWGSGFYGTYYPSQDGSALGAFVQRFDANGAPLGPEFRANTYTPGPQYLSGVAAHADGSFVVVWQSGGYGGVQDGSGPGIFAQRYDSAGGPVGTEFRVNTTTLGNQSDPAVAAEASGGFVVVWRSNNYLFPGSQDGSGPGVFGQRFSSSGAPLGPEFQVNTYTTGRQENPVVAANPLGGFVVAWQSSYYAGGGQDGSGVGVFAQRFDGAGARTGPEFQVNSFTTGTQTYPSLAVDPAGSFVVAWTSYGQDGSSSAAVGRRFSSAGAPDGPDFVINSFTPGYQTTPVVAAPSTHHFVVVWEDGSGSLDPSSSGIAARHFRIVGPLRPLAGTFLRLKDDPPSGAGKSLLVRAADTGVTLGGGNDSVDDPTLTGGRLRVRSATFDHTYELPAANWRTIGLPGADLGYVYRDRFLVDGPVVRVKIRSGRVLRVEAKGAQLGHILAANPDPATVILQTGDAGHRYCLTFGGVATYRPNDLSRAQGAPAGCAP